MSFSHVQPVEKHHSLRVDLQCLIISSEIMDRDSPFTMAKDVEEQLQCGFTPVL